MYKSASRFMRRLPGRRFWSEYANIYDLKSVDSEEILISALSDTIRFRGCDANFIIFSDYELSGLAILCGKRVRIGMYERPLTDLDSRIERDDNKISFSENERFFGRAFCVL